MVTITTFELRHRDVIVATSRFSNMVLFFSQEDSKVFGHARYLDQFFEQQLRKWLPQYTLGLTMAAATAETSDGGAHDASFTSSAKRPRTAIETDEVIS